MITSASESELQLSTRNGIVTAKYSEMNEIMDLESAAKRSRQLNVKWGILSVSFTTAFMYLATASSVEGKETFFVPALGFLGLTIYSFAHKSDEEQEFEERKNAGTISTDDVCPSSPDIQCRLGIGSMGGGYIGGKWTPVGSQPSVAVQIRHGF